MLLSIFDLVIRYKSIQFYNPLIQVAIFFRLGIPDSKAPVGKNSYQFAVDCVEGVVCLVR